MTDQCLRCGQPFQSWTSTVIQQYCPLCEQAVREALDWVILETEKEKLWLDFNQEAPTDE